MSNSPIVTEVDATITRLGNIILSVAWIRGNSRSGTVIHKWWNGYKTQNAVLYFEGLREWNETKSFSRLGAGPLVTRSLVRPLPRYIPWHDLDDHIKHLNRNGLL